MEIGTIGKELGKLWEESGDTKTRASLINLAIYTENPDAVPWNTGLIAEIAGEHACRALLIFADPASEKPDARAWISAHCHLAGKGERQICSEQITFELDGEMVRSLPNIVFSHLDSDLPLYFWWQGEFREPLDQKLWSWIDRLIFDSADWQKPVEQLAIARKIATLNAQRTILCDLNWTRLLGTRFALAQLFDHSCANARMREIEKVTITTSRRSTGLLLLAGWPRSLAGGSSLCSARSSSFRRAAGTSISASRKSRARRSRRCRSRRRMSPSASGARNTPSISTATLMAAVSATRTWCCQRANPASRTSCSWN